MTSNACRGKYQHQNQRNFEPCTCNDRIFVRHRSRLGCRIRIRKEVQYQRSTTQRPRVGCIHVCVAPHIAWAEIQTVLISFFNDGVIKEKRNAGRRIRGQSLSPAEPQEQTWLFARCRQANHSFFLESGRRQGGKQDKAAARRTGSKSPSRTRMIHPLLTMR